MGHIESQIKNLKGILRVFSPYFYWRICHIKVQRHTLYTNYLFSYCRKYIVHYSLFKHTPIRPTRSNDYWSIIIWLAREFAGHVESKFFRWPSRENRQKEEHSGGTYVYGTYKVPSTPRATNTQPIMNLISIVTICPAKLVRQEPDHTHTSKVQQLS